MCGYSSYSTAGSLCRAETTCTSRLQRLEVGIEVGIAATTGPKLTNNDGVGVTEAGALTTGKFKRVLLLAGCDSIAEAYAKVCHSAIQGWGTDCKALVRILVTCSHQVANDTREAYARLYDEDLVAGPLHATSPPL